MRSKPWVPAPLREPLAPLRRALDPWLSWRPPLPRHLRLQWALMRDEWRLRRSHHAPEAWPEPLDWGQGLSVVIPERGGVDLLGQCLAAAQEALIRVHEPTEIIVVVNGSPESDYAALRARHPGVLWRFHAQALGFTRAVLDGIAQARHGAIYLLNNDMQLDPDALAAAMAWRSPGTFAVASEIHFPRDGRRREETGWTHMPVEAGLPAPWHAEARSSAVRGTVWAGAGSALFHAGRLREWLPASLPFDPFYWEDVDLGLRAWRAGYDSLYCPASRALHLHRVTVRRHYPEAEVERIFERNRLQIALRHRLSPDDWQAVHARLSRLDATTAAELAAPSALAELRRARLASHRARFRDIDLATRPQILLNRPVNPGGVLWVTPFAVVPVRHGGALRTVRLARELARDHELVLLMDEAHRHGPADDAGHAPFAAVYPVDGRPRCPADPGDRLGRMRTHTHAALRLEFQRLVAIHRPAVVVVEHMELAPLIEVDLPYRPRFVLNLADVLLTPEDLRAAHVDAAERALIAHYDGVVASSAEDLALLDHPRSVLAGNGCDPDAAADYMPSKGATIACFAPARAKVNWLGIRDFVREAWPHIRAAHPHVRLIWVGGPEAQAMVAGEPGFDDSSIQVLDSVPAVAPLLGDAALTINPQPTLRGSSIKVLESLAHGRICLSTRAGARGHHTLAFPGLICRDSVADFAEIAIALLHDADLRHRLERPNPAILARASWEACANPLRNMVRHLSAMAA